MKFEIKKEKHPTNKAHAFGAVGVATNGSVILFADGIRIAYGWEDSGFSPRFIGDGQERIQEAYGLDRLGAFMFVQDKMNELNKAA